MNTEYAGGFGAVSEGSNGQTKVVRTLLLLSRVETLLSIFPSDDPDKEQLQGQKELPAETFLEASVKAASVIKQLKEALSAFTMQPGVTEIQASNFCGKVRFFLERALLPLGMDEEFFFVTTDEERATRWLYDCGRSGHELAMFVRLAECLNAYHTMLSPDDDLFAVKYILGAINSNWRFPPLFIKWAFASSEEIFSAAVQSSIFYRSVARGEVEAKMNELKMTDYQRKLVFFLADRCINLSGVRLGEKQIRELAISLLARAGSTDSAIKAIIEGDEGSLLRCAAPVHPDPITRIRLEERFLALLTDVFSPKRY